MHRFRDRNQPDQNLPYAYRSYDKYGKLVGSSDRSFLGYRYREEMSDVVTPGYHEKIARGQLIINPLSRTLSTITEEVASDSQNKIGDSSYVTFSGMITARSLTDYPADLTKIVKMEDEVGVLARDMLINLKADAIAKLDQTPYAFMEDLAELSSTMKTLTNPLHSAKVAASKFYRKTEDRKGFYLKRKSLRRAEALARAAGDAWLSSRYEFRPIMYTIRDVYLGLPKIHTKSLKRMKAVAFGSFARGTAGVLPSTASNLEYSFTYDHKYQAKVVLYYTMTNPIDYRDWDLGVRLKDVPKTVWALMPYSWLVDKFVDVSNSIQALTNLADPRLNILGGCITIEREEDRTYQSIAYPSTGWSGVVTGGVRHEHSKNVVRTSYRPTIHDAIQPTTVAEALHDPSTLLDSASVILQRLTFGGKLAHVSFRS